MQRDDSDPKAANKREGDETKASSRPKRSKRTVGLTTIRSYAPHLSVEEGLRSSPLAPGSEIPEEERSSSTTSYDVNTPGRFQPIVPHRVYSCQSDNLTTITAVNIMKAHGIEHIVFVSPHAFKLPAWWIRHKEEIGISFHHIKTTESTREPLPPVGTIEEIFSYVDSILRENEDEAVMIAHYGGCDNAYSVHILSSLLYARCHEDSATMTKQDVHERMIQYASFRGNIPSTRADIAQLGKGLYIPPHQIVYNDETNYAPSKKRLEECLDVLFPKME